MAAHASRPLRDIAPTRFAGHYRYWRVLIENSNIVAILDGFGNSQDVGQEGGGDEFGHLVRPGGIGGPARASSDHVIGISATAEPCRAHPNSLRTAERIQPPARRAPHLSPRRMLAFAIELQHRLRRSRRSSRPARIAEPPGPRVTQRPMGPPAGASSPAPELPGRRNGDGTAFRSPQWERAIPCRESRIPARGQAFPEMKGNIALNMFPFISLDAVSRMPSS